MKRLMVLSLASVVLAGCGQDAAEAPSAEQATAPAAVSGEQTPTLAEARRGFRTKPGADQPAADPIPAPPEHIFQRIDYEAPVGKLGAYLSPDPGDGKKHPAIVWITGGDCNSIGEVWEDLPRENDQSAAAYRKAGIIMMFPSLRGGNDNPGKREGYFGEVDDILAATDDLARRAYVDPKRIYLGGHSTGGTLVMLVAELSDRFRGVFSFGPVASVSGYGPEYLPFNDSDETEVRLRSPAYWLDSVRSPLFVFEGTDEPANIDALRVMARISKNPLVHFLPVAGLSHFSVLAPVNDIIAAKILADTGPATNLSFSEQELAAIPK